MILLLKRFKKESLFTEMSKSDVNDITQAFLTRHTRSIAYFE